MFLSRASSFLNQLFQRIFSLFKSSSVAGHSKNLNLSNNMAVTPLDIIADELGAIRVTSYEITTTIVAIQLQSSLHKFNLKQYSEIFDLYRAKIIRNDSNIIELIFKNQQSENHQILALSFLRDFIKLDPIFSKTIRCYITSGTLLFNSKEDTQKFTGTNLDEINLFLKTTPTDGLIFINESLIQNFSPYGVFLKTEYGFYVAQKLTSISEVLETFQPLESACYFRNSDDLAQTLHYLSEKIVEGESHELREAFYRLKTFQIRNKNQALLNAYKCLLNLVIRLYRQNPDLKQILSACISIAKNILSADSFDDELRELFNWCLQFKNPRIKANTVEALGYFDPNNPTLRTFSNSKFNRVAAESIIIQSKKELTDELANQILDYLKSGNPFFVASGLYIIGDICEFYFHNNYQYYISNPNFKKIVEQAKIFKSHTHSMVRKRALQTFKIIDSFKGAA